MMPRPAKFSRNDVVRAASSALDEFGVEELTMRRVAAVLEVDPMALYRHFPSKAHLVAALADDFWEQLEVPLGVPGEAWREYAERFMLQIHGELRGRPNLIPLVATHPISSEAALRVADHGVGRMIAAGAPVVPALGDLLNALVILTVASALGEFGPPAGSFAGELAPLTLPGEAHSNPLAELPSIGLLLRAGWQSDQHRQFVDGLKALLSGWKLD